MKIQLVYLRGQRCAWSEAALEEFTQKIDRLLKFEIIELKSPAIPRDRSEEKCKAEEKKILNWLDDKAKLVLFDELGKDAGPSENFAKLVNNYLESNTDQLVFLIGGPYGVTEKVRARADRMIKLSSLTFNHNVALVAAAEQIYRGLTILKNIPYHNR